MKNLLLDTIRAGVLCALVLVNIFAPLGGQKPAHAQGFGWCVFSGTTCPNQCDYRCWGGSIGPMCICNTWPLTNVQNCEGWCGICGEFPACGGTDAVDPSEGCACVDGCY